MQTLRPRNLLIVGLIVVIGLLVAYHKEIIRYFHMRAIVAENLDGRLIPHRVNRVDKLASILDKGIRSFEIDLLLRSEGARVFFEAGHSDEDARGVPLHRFLEMLRGTGPRKIWLDIKNLDDNNMHAAVLELRRLDSIYAVKEIAIVESSTTSDSFSRFRNAGFHTSYYLPTERITSLLTLDDREKLTREALKIAAQIDRQSVSAVSFNLTLYPFVKQYLEPVIADSIVYHAWDSVDLRKWGALNRLKSTDYYRDTRLETLIYGL
jgi:hypothetical protein